jgi:mRNA interferase MazF
MIDPTRGEIWLIEFDPVRGAEIGKIRPAVVISVPHVGRLPLKIIVTITDWKEHYQHLLWMKPIEPSRTNGLSKLSGADAFQCKSFSIERFKKKLGRIQEEELQEVIDAVALCIGKT